jgi:hypothetical protein
MAGHPRSNEWNRLKDQFDAIAHNENMREDSIEKFFDNQIRRRFGEWITWAAERRIRTDDDARRKK